MPGKPLRVLLAPATQSEATLYEDDGLTLDYRNGTFAARRFHQTRDDKTAAIEISAPAGPYRPAARDLVLELWLEQAPAGVSAGTGPAKAPLSRFEAATLAKAPRGWMYADGLLTVKDRDTFEPMHFSIER
jgi:hypothetical protein